MMASIEMTQMMRRPKPQLLASVDNPEKLACQAMVAWSSSSDEIRPTGCEEKSFEDGEAM